VHFTELLILESGNIRVLQKCVFLVRGWICCRVLLRTFCFLQKHAIQHRTIKAGDTTYLLSGSVTVYASPETVRILGPVDTDYSSVQTVSITQFTWSGLVFGLRAPNSFQVYLSFRTKGSFSTVFQNYNHGHGQLTCHNGWLYLRVPIRLPGTANQKTVKPLFSKHNFRVPILNTWNCFHRGLCVRETRQFLGKKFSGPLSFKGPERTKPEGKPHFVKNRGRGKLFNNIIPRWF